MKSRLIGAIAVAFALGQLATPAFAETPAHFRSAAPQTFSQTDLQRYGLSSADAAKVGELQAQGYRVQVMTPAEAAQVRGGAWVDNTWLIVGAVVVVVIIIAASN